MEFLHFGLIILKEVRRGIRFPCIFISLIIDTSVTIDGHVQTVFDPFFIISYNVVYTSLPVLVLGIFEQDVCDTLSTRYPRIYWPGLGHRFFNPLSFASAALHGVATSVLVFFVPIGTYAVCLKKKNPDAKSVGSVWCLYTSSTLTSNCLLKSSPKLLRRYFFFFLNRLFRWMPRRIPFSLLLASDLCL